MCFKQAQRYSVHRDIAFVGLEHDNPFFSADLFLFIVPALLEEIVQTR